MADLTETTRRMADLQSKNTPHAWWGVAEALLAVLDSDNTEAIKLAEETFTRRFDEAK